MKSTTTATNTRMSSNLKKSLVALAIVTVLSACSASTNEAENTTVGADEPFTTVTEANFAHSETARNFRNWTMLGANKDIVHMKQLPARGKAAPTVQMNDDTLYSIVIAEAVDGKINFSIPKSDVYMAVQVVNEGGHGEHYVVASGDYSVAIESDFAMLIYRTGTEKGLDAARHAQTFIETDSFKFGTYEIQDYDYEEVEAWVSRLTKETSGAAFEYTFPRTSKDITDRHQWNLENANGWGGSSPEVNVANKYTNSVMLDSGKCLITTFENPESKYFTSVTAYSQDRYLIEGVKNVNSHTWKENINGSVTVSFNCGQTAINNIDTKGNDFTFTMRYYGLSQKVMDGKINPEKTVKEG